MLVTCIDKSENIISSLNHEKIYAIVITNSIFKISKYEIRHSYENICAIIIFKYYLFHHNHMLHTRFILESGNRRLIGLVGSGEVSPPTHSIDDCLAQNHFGTKHQTHICAVCTAHNKQRTILHNTQHLVLHCHTTTPFSTFLLH